MIEINNKFCKNLYGKNDFVEVFKNLNRYRAVCENNFVRPSK